jgi:hypothetical protein
LPEKGKASLRSQLPKVFFQLKKNFIFKPGFKNVFKMQQFVQFSIILKQNWRLALNQHKLYKNIF